MGRGLSAGHVHGLHLSDGRSVTFELFVHHPKDLSLYRAGNLGGRLIIGGSALCRDVSFRLATYQHGPSPSELIFGLNAPRDPIHSGY